MSLEAMKSIAAAEERVRQLKSENASDVKRKIAEAIADGEALVAEAVRKADAELALVNASAVSKAKESAQGLAGNSENRKAEMRARAESKMDKASELIVERIVNG